MTCICGSVNAVVGRDMVGENAGTLDLNVETTAEGIVEAAGCSTVVGCIEAVGRFD